MILKIPRNRLVAVTNKKKVELNILKLTKVEAGFQTNYLYFFDFCISLKCLFTLPINFYLFVKRKENSC